MTDVVETCKWKSTPMTPKTVNGRTYPGFADQWNISCIPSHETLRIEPRSDWVNCPYCGLPIEWLTDPNDPSLPQTITRVV